MSETKITRPTNHLLTDKRPVMMYYMGSPVCLIMADIYLLATQICDDYADYVDFERRHITCHFLEHNVLIMDRVIT